MIFIGHVTACSVLKKRLTKPAVFAQLLVHVSPKKKQFNLKSLSSFFVPINSSSAIDAQYSSGFMVSALQIWVSSSKRCQPPSKLEAALQIVIGLVFYVFFMLLFLCVPVLRIFAYVQYGPNYFGRR